jgi:phosphatidate cytidylyltransferase
VQDLRRRAITAVIYAAVVLLAVAAPQIVFWIVLAVAGRFGLSELVALRVGRPAVVFGAVFFGGLISLGLLKAAGALGAGAEIADSLPVWLLLTIISTWAADVAAYLVGSVVGRRRIAPSISPGKTLEGTVAGFAASAIAVLAIAVVFGLPRAPAVILAIGLGPIGLGGDLLESYVKRRAGVKDSGAILPGHGGLLDRLDSLTADATFVVAVFLTWLLYGVGAEGIVDRF